jgi:hypothetical protein
MGKDRMSAVQFARIETPDIKMVEVSPGMLQVPTEQC